MNLRVVFSAVLSLIFSLLGSLAVAGPIYICDSSGQFGTITLDGTFTSIGLTRSSTGSIVPMGDLAVSQSGQVYGVSYSSALDGGKLYRIDPNTAQCSIVSNLGFYSAAATFGPDGLIYSSNGTNLVTIDPITGNVTTIGDMGVSSDGDLQFDTSGNLFMTGGHGHLYSVDKATGNAVDLGFNGTQNLFFLGLAQIEGVMYGFSASQGIYTIDTTNNTVTPFVAYAGAPPIGNVFGADVAAVPEPNTVLVLATGLALVFLAKRRIH